MQPNSLIPQKYASKRNFSQAWILFKKMRSQMLFNTTHQVLFLCLMIGAAIVSGVSFFSHGVMNALNKDIATYLGAPLVLRGNQSVDSSWWNELPIKPSVETLAITQGAIANVTYRSVSLKAINSNYPVQNSLKLRIPINSNEHSEITATGADLSAKSAWLDSRAMQELNVNIGEHIQIGSATFTVAAEILFEPDKLTQLQHVLPRVMVHLQDLKKTGININSGRAEFRYLFDGSKADLEETKNRLNQKLAANQQILTPDTGNHPFSRIAMRTTKLFGMVSVLVLLLCGSAAAILAEHSVRSHIQPATFVKCMGVGKSAYAFALLMQLMLIALIASLVGSLLGWLLQPVLKSLLEPHLMLEPVAYQISIAFVSLLMTTLILVFFIYPRLRQLNSIPVLNILRGAPLRNKNFALQTIMTLSAISCLIWYFTDNIRLTFYMLIGLLSVLTLSLLCAWSISRIAGKLYKFSRGSIKVVLRQIHHQPNKNIISISIISVATLSLLMTSTLRHSFLDSYQIQRLNTDGNYLYSGLPANEAESFAALMAQNNTQIKGKYPTILAHLITVNDVPLDEFKKQESDTLEELRSPVRLSWSKDIPNNNTMLEGEWPKPGHAEVSVEAEVMADMGLNMHDKLGFSIGQEFFQATITSTREYKSGGSRVMFWFMFSEQTLNQFNQEYLGGIDSQQNTPALLKQINALHPNVLITDLEQHMKSMRAIMSSLTTLMNALLTILLIAVFSVFMASAFVRLTSVQHSFSLLRAIGVNNRQLMRMHLLEQVIVCLLGCAAGIVGTSFIAGMMFDQMFALPFQADHAYQLLLTITITLGFVLFTSLLMRFKLKQPIRAFQQL